MTEPLEPINTQITSLQEAIDLMGGQENLLAFINSHPDEAYAAVKQLDPLGSMSDRADVAEQMLDQYHLLKSNLKIREAIHRNLWDRRASSERTREAYDAVVQAQAELDQLKFEILELMGVDS